MFLKNKLVPLVTALTLVFAAPAVSFAQTGSPPQDISLSDAINMAQNSNVNLVVSNIQLQQATNSLGNANQNSPNVTPPNLFSNPQAAQALIGQVNANYQQQSAAKNYAYEKDNVIYQTEAAYFAVQDAVYGEQVAEKSAEQAQEAYNIAQVSLQQGVETATDVSTAKSNLDLAKSKLTAAQAGVDAAYVNFDNMVGLDPMGRPDLTTAVSYDPTYLSGLVDIQQAVSQTLENSPQAFTAQTNVYVQNELQPYSNPTENGPLNYQQALLSQQLTIQGLTISARAAFLAVGSDQDAYDAAARGVIAAQASDSNAQASYNAGVITKNQLLQADLAYLSAKQGLQSSLHQLLLARANLALITGVGSVTIPVSGQ